MNKLFLLFLFILAGCSYSGANKAYELEEMEQDVLKKDEGVEITIKPIPKEVKK